MATLKKIWLLSIFFLLFWFKGKRNLFGYHLFVFSLLILTFCNIHILIFLNFFVFSFYFLIQLFNEDNIANCKSLFKILNIRPKESHTTKIILIYIFMCLPFFISHFYLKNQTHINVHYVVEIFYSLTTTFTLAVNFFKLRSNSLKLVLFIFSSLIFFLINLLLNFKLFFPISLLIIIIITIYTYKNAEYNFI